MAKVFQSRLKLLRDDLRTLQMRLTTLSVPLQNSVEWHVSQGELSRQAKNRLDVITDLLAGPEDWNQFNQIREDVAQISLEVLEIVQGLAILSGDTDNSCCLIVRKFLEGIGQEDLGLTVFTARELNIPTLARLTRLRFPVKSIWTLPLAAYQYAKMTIESTPVLTKFAEGEAGREVDRLVPKPHATALEEAAVKTWKAQAYSRWVQLMSVGLAVYFAGPCYAGSAILLQSSPATPDVSNDSMSKETDRAFVILEMLRQLPQTDGNPQDEVSAYNGFILWLQKQWNDMLTQAGTADLSEQRRSELKDFVRSLIRAARGEVSFGRYPFRPPDQDFPTQPSWSTAELWSHEWESNLTNNRPLRVPNGANRLSDVRDALNAGWLCWSKADDPEKADVLTTAVLELCKAIVKPPDLCVDEPQQPLEPSTRPSTRAK